MIQTRSYAIVGAQPPASCQILLSDRVAAGAIAHDLNNVLQIISGNLSMLSLEVGESSAARRYIASALAGVDLGTRLARRALMKEVTPTSHGTTRDLAEAIATLEQLVRDAVGTDISVTFHVCQPRDDLSLDLAELQNVVLNLAINARDAMSGKGDLTIVFAGDRTGLSVSVSDTGCGMTPEIVVRAFQPFFTTKGHAGSGLGLAGVKRFVDEAGGTASISSRIGEGTTVCLRLPQNNPEGRGSPTLAHEEIAL